MTASPDWLQGFVGTVVVAEIGDHCTVFGRLAEVGEHHLLFAEADLHDQSTANSSADAYASETQRLGVRPNRAILAVPRQRLVAIARLADVVA